MLTQFIAVVIVAVLVFGIPILMLSCLFCYEYYTNKPLSLNRISKLSAEKRMVVSELLENNTPVTIASLTCGLKEHRGKDKADALVRKRAAQVAKQKMDTKALLTSLGKK
jgi:hypothetical protein